ncbi:glycosyltransferase [Enterococcus faecium]|nr:glycosyltransferase [Enterococcus faecium]
MKVIYVSNFMNHHVRPVADELFETLGNNFIFVETARVRSDNSLKGSEVSDFLNIPYLYSFYNSSYNLISEKKLISLLEGCDVVIQGDTSDKYIKANLKKNKLIFRVSEHILKGSKLDFLRIIKYFLRNLKLRNRKVYLLCASSHTALDMRKANCFIGKTYRWGYFPTIFNKEDQCFSEKISTILWVGRMIDWKHPEYILHTARILHSENISAVINVVGEGELFDDIRQEIELAGLNQYVNFKGKLNSNQVQHEMKVADVFIFTSDKAEGWGAVLNESMGNACIPVASKLAGSTNYLVQNNVNGFIYDGSLDSFSDTLKIVLSLPDDRIKNIKKAAYNTIKEEWTSKVAVRRLIDFIESVDDVNQLTSYHKGPMSRTD